MPRILLVPILTGSLLVAGSFAGAGNGPTWTSSPTQGPSPNTISVSGNGCIGEVMGVPVGGDASVRLFSPDGSVPLTSFQGPYQADMSGDWSGSFAIPAGLDPATYVLKARCDAAPETNDFEYVNTRPYTVVAAAETPEPVESEVTFTG